MKLVLSAFFLHLTFFTVAQTNCTTSVQVTDVNCYGQATGSATVVTPSVTIGSGACIAPSQPTVTCASCNVNVTATSGDISVSSGQKVCIGTGANFNGNITFGAGGGTLVICGTATIQNMNFNNGSSLYNVVVLGSATFANLNMTDKGTLTNYGTFTFSNGSGFNGQLVNHGTMTAANGDFSVNSNTAKITNYGLFTVNASYNNNTITDNYGTITVSGDLKVNGTSFLRNFCTINVGAEFHVNNLFVNSGKVTVGSVTRVTNIYELKTSALHTTLDVVLDGVIKGTGTSCGQFKVTRNIQTMNGTVQGLADFCDPNAGVGLIVSKVISPATSNCTCGNSGSGTFVWNSPLTGTGKTLNNLSAGTYSVNVSLPGCTTQVKSFTVKQPSSALFSTVTVNNTTATVTATGGTSPFSYSWDNAIFTSNNQITSLSVGSHTVKVKDSKGCTFDKTFSVTNCTVSIQKGDVSCFGQNTGTASVVLPSGVTAISYSWTTSGNPTTQSVSNIISGSYTVTVQLSGCTTQVLPFTIIQPTIALSSSVAVNNNSATVTATGGTSPYTYSWDNAAFTSITQMSSLSIGSNTVKVKDSKGCIFDKTFTVGAVNCSTSAQTTNINCNGQNSGAASIILPLGVTATSYSWTTPNNPITQSVNNLTAGSYSATVQLPGCTTQVLPFTITQPISSLASNVVVSGNIATVNASGGTPIYTYSWDNNTYISSNSITGLNVGSHNVVTKDSKGCTSSSLFDVLTQVNCSTSVQVTNVNCYGQSTGSATVITPGSSLGAGACVTPSQPNVSCASCSVNVTSTNGDISISEGQKVCIGSGVNFNGNVTFGAGGGTLVICGTATIQNMNFNNGSSLYNVIVLGNATFANLNMTDKGKLTNYGTFTFSNGSGFNGELINHGTMTAANGDFSVNASTAKITNYGLFTVNASYNNNTITDNYGTLTVGGDLKVNGTSLLRNFCTINVGAEFHVNNLFVNSGKVSVGSVTRVTSTYELKTSALHTTQDLVLDGIITGTGTSCGQFKVTRTIQTMNGKVQGLTDFCAPNAGAGLIVSKVEAPATRNCSCGGGGSGTFTWNSPLTGTGSTINSLPAGTYSVNVTLPGCTTQVKTFTVKQPNSALASVVTLNNNSATVAVTGGTFPFTYSWDNAAFTRNNQINSLPTGLHTVSVKDSNNCILTKTFSIENCSGIIFSTKGFDLGCDLTGGKIEANTNAFNYVLKLNGIVTTFPVTNLSVGIYQVSLEVPFCNISRNESVVIGGQPNLTLTLDVTQPSCSGNRATLVASVPNGKAPFTFHLDGNKVGLPIWGLSAGTHTLKVTDASGCTKTETFMVQPIAEPLDMAISFEGLKATVNVTGGSGQFTYTWKNGGEGQTKLLTENIPDVLTIKDNVGGCVLERTVVVNSCLALVLEANSGACGQLGTGFVIASVSKGTGNYSYSWTGRTETTSDIDKLASGNYTLTVTDNGKNPTCSISQNFSIESKPFGLDVVVNGTSAVVTYKNAKGIVKTTWSDGYLGENRTNLVPGKYIVYVVDDATGCSDSKEITIGKPICKVLVYDPSVVNGGTGTSTSGNSVTLDPNNPINLTSFGVKVEVKKNTYSNCNTSNQDGYIKLTTVNNVGQVVIACDKCGTQNTTNITQITNGDSYEMVLTDLGTGECITLIVKIPPTTLPVVQTVTNTDGSVTASANCSTCTYTWSNGTIGTTLPSNVPNGVYTLTVCSEPNNTNCTIIPVSKGLPNCPDKKTVQFNTTNVTCYNGTDGSASVITQFTGGNTYTYHWSNVCVGGGATLTNLGAGQYNVIIWDGTRNCVAGEGIAAVTKPTPIVVNYVENPKGTFTFSASGGTLPGYTYYWNGVVLAGNTYSSTTPGIYTVKAVDSKGCSGETIVIIKSTPLPCGATVSATHISCSGANDGKASVALGFAYNWFSPAGIANKTSANVGGLTQGIQKVVVTGANCSETLETNILSPLPLGVILNVLSDAVFVTVTGGTGSPKLSLDNGNYTNKTTFLNLSSGSHTLTVKDDNGCSYTKSFTVTNPCKDFGISLNASSTNVTCYGLTNGSITAVVIGTNTYTLKLNNIERAFPATGLGKGNYIIKLETPVCSLSTLVPIIEPSLLSLSANVNSTKCTGSGASYISAFASGGTLPYQFKVNNAPANMPFVLPATGSYIVSVADKNNCPVASKTINFQDIVEPLQVAIITDGWTAKVSTKGGLGSPSFKWNDNITTGSRSFTSEGTYVLTVADQSGCPSVVKTVVVGPCGMSMVFDLIQGTCVNRGAASSAVTGASGDYTFSWSPNTSTGATVADLVAGNYTLTVSDKLNPACKIIKPFLVSGRTNTGLSVDVTNSNGNVNLAPSTYKYVWLKDNVEAASRSNLLPGEYKIDASSASGCKQTLLVNVVGKPCKELIYDATIDPSLNIRHVDNIINQVPGALGVKIETKGNDRTDCNASAGNGFIRLTLTNGSGDYVISCSECGSQQNTTYVSGVEPGETYHYTVTDTKSGECLNITVKVPDAIKTTATVTTNVSGQPVVNAICPSGTCVFTYTAPNGTTSSILPTATGIYTVKVCDQTSAGNCTITTVNNGVPVCTNPQTLVFQTTGLACYTDATGTKTIYSGGGIKLTNTFSGNNYSYLWTNTCQQNTTQLTGVSPGSYQVTVWDKTNNCVAGVGMTTLSLPAPVLVSKVKNVNGSFTLSATGGSAPYTFFWSTTSICSQCNQVDYTPVGTGTFVVKAVDSKGCTGFINIYVPPVDCPTPITISGADVSCFGLSDGTASVIAPGFANSYYWSGSSLINNKYASSISPLKKGVYNVTVTKQDVPVCVWKIGREVKEPTQIVGSYTSQAGRKLWLSASGGNGLQPNDYTYKWVKGPSGVISPALIGNYQEGLPDGNYEVVITDVKGCMTTYSFLYTDVACLAFQNQTYVKIENGNTARVVAAAGVLPYLFAWNGGVQGTSDTYPVSGTGVTVTVKDAKGCEKTLNTGQCPVATSVLTQPKCRDDKGSIILGIQGFTDTSGFSFLWKDGVKGNERTLLNAGVYEGAVKNKVSGCQTPYVPYTIVYSNLPCIDEPPVCTDFTVELVSAKGETCFGDNQGKIDVKVTGGKEAFFYDWTYTDLDGNATTTRSIDPDVIRPKTGSYSLVAYSNDLKCKATLSTTITGATGALKATVTKKEDSPCVGGNGTAEIKLEGGYGTYTISWVNKTNQAVSFTSAGGTLTASSLKANAYELVVTDQKLCKAYANVTIYESDPNVSVYANGNTICTDKPDSELELSVSPMPGYRINWYKEGSATSLIERNYLTVKTAGKYIAKFTKAGCSDITAERTIGSTICLVPSSVTCGSAIYGYGDTTNSVNVCRDMLINIAKANGLARYEAYYTVEKENFRKNYIAKCLEAKEQLKIKYQEREQHYTLYYYDQSGNLVRTVPPEGVRPLDATKTHEVATLRAAGKGNLPTEHILATTNNYNSLNQLQTQDMPDHDRQNIFNTEASTKGVDANETPAEIAFGNASRGIMVANGANDGFIYSTTDGGKNWDKVPSLKTEDLYHVQKAGIRTFAVGDKGTLLYSDNTDWNFESIGEGYDLRGLHMIGASQGFGLTKEGDLYYINFTGTNLTTLDPVTKVPNLTRPSGTVSDFYTDNIAGAFYTASNNASIGNLTTYRVVTSPNLAISEVEGVVYPTEISHAAVGGLEGFVALAPNNLVYELEGGNATLPSIVDASHLNPLVGVNTPASINRMFASANLYYALVPKGAKLKLYSSISAADWQEAKINATEQLPDLTTLVQTTNGLVAYADGNVAYTNDIGNKWRLYNYTNSDNISYVSTSIANELVQMEAGLKVYRKDANSGGAFNELPYFKTQISDVAATPTYTDGAVVSGLPSGEKARLAHIVQVSTVSNDIQALAFVQFNKVYRLKSIGIQNSKPGETRYQWEDAAQTADRLSFSNNLDGVAVTNSPGLTLKTTIDGGSNWSSLSLPSLGAGETIVDLEILPHTTNLNIVAFTNKGGVFNYNGTAWSAKASPKVKPLPINAVYAKNSNAVAVGDKGSILTSTDAGTNWYFALGKTTTDLDKVVVDDNSVVWAIDKQGDLYKDPATGTVASVQVSDKVTELVFDGSSTDKAIYAITNDGLSYKINTTDGTVEDPETVSDGLSLNGFAMVAKTTTAPITYDLLIAANTGNVFKRDAADSYTNIAALRTSQLSGVAFADNNTAYAVGQRGTVVKSSDAGQTWKTLPATTTQNLKAIVANGNNIVAVGDNATVIYSVNAGSSWTKASTTGTYTLKDVYQADGVWMAVGTNGKVLKSTTGALATWTVETSLPSGVGTTSLNAVHIVDASFISVVGDGGLILRRKDGTWNQLQTSALVNWTTQNLNDTYYKDYVTGYAVGANGEMWKTTDGGVTFKNDKKPYTGTPEITQLAVRADGEFVALTSDPKPERVTDRADIFGSQYWYDELGRMVLSQNAKQFANQNASYTLYDAIGRITEVGELTGVGYSDIQSKTTTFGNQLNYADAQAIVASKTNRQITRTYYDTKQLSPKDENNNDFEQKRLRNRVASVTYTESGTVYDQATHYNYDIHGNVSDLLQEIQLVGGGSLRKKMHYDYDLISGKVNQVSYQTGKADQFIHRYQYDADNRISMVETSRDGVLWEQDANYQYYSHGPLARTTLAGGIEQMDNTYTLQGWVKQVKGNSYSYALGYNGQDYSPIESTVTASLLGTPIAINKDLYNGNIATMANKNSGLLSGNALTQQFVYDQLNRIKSSNTATGGNSYKTTYDYDANGNILNLNRYDKDGTQFDAMAYTYERTKDANDAATGFLRNSNRLINVNDTEGFSSLSAIDIDDQGALQNDTDFGKKGNYGYDQIGNLKTDAQELIKEITWNVYGKVQKVEREPNSGKYDLAFTYDATGNRVSKVATKGTEVNKTYYVRDAQGNVMGIYEDIAGTGLALAEQNVYGSSMLGTARPTSTVPVADVYSVQLDKKEYYLKDHLGNTRVLLSDKVENGVAGLLAAYEYYPFGMEMAHSFKNGVNGSRYGYNTQEKVDEIAPGHYTAEYWEYDSRTGRRWNLDPVPDESESQYAVNKNNPIQYNDPDGDCPLCVTALVGAVSGAAFEYGTQVVGNLIDGQELGDALTNVDGAEIGKAAVVGAAVGLGLGAAGAGVKALTKVKKAADIINKSDEAVSAATKSGNLQKLKEGIAFENQYFDDLAESGEKVVRRVSYKAVDPKTGKSVRAVVDGVKKSNLEHIETKLSQSTSLTKNQKVVYKALEKGQATPVGKNAAKAGLKVGEKAPPTKVTRVNRR